MRTLILYYSRTGNNRFLAEKLARALSADLEPIRPRLDVFGLLLFFSWIRLSPGNRRLAHDPASYGRVVLVGPIWTGLLISPIRDVIRKYRRQVREFVFLTCCGSTDKDKDSRFGFATIFAKARALAEDKFGACAAFPVLLTVPEGEEVEDAEVLDLHLTDANFTGELERRFDRLVDQLSAPVGEAAY